MSKSPIATTDSLPILSAAFAARRARLLLDLSSEPARISNQRPIARLQAHGYTIATGLALTAALPIVLRVLLRQKKLIFKILLAVFRIRKVRRSIAGATRSSVRAR